MYLIYGESFRLIEEEIAKIIKEETNIVTMDLYHVSLHDVLVEAGYDSLFLEKKFLIVKNASFFTSAKTNEEEMESFLNYMEHPNSLTTLIFTTYDKIDSRKKVTKMFGEKNKIVSVGGLKPNDLVSKVRDLFFSKKYKINTETLSYLVSACGNNYDLIYNEANKLFLYYNEPQTISLEDVKEIVSKSIEDNHFRFVEAVIAKDINKAVHLLDDLYVLKVEPITLLMLLAREYRILYSAISLRSMGYPIPNISKHLGLQNWQVEKSLRSSSSYYMNDLSMYLKQLAKLDYEIKSGKIDRFLALKTFLFTIA